MLKRFFACLAAAILFLIGALLTLGALSGGSCGGTLATGRGVNVRSDSWYLNSTFSGDTATIKTAGRTIVISPTNLQVDGHSLTGIDASVKSVDVIVEGSAISFVADSLGNVFISGTTNGSLVPSDVHINDFDAFVGKYSAAGDLIWLRQFGTTEFDVSAAPSADGLGNVFISGVTPGSAGGPGAGSQDVFVRKYDTAGNVLWKRQFGSSAEDTAGHVSADGSENVYVSGSTRGSLGGPSAGSQDAFVARYFVPEPSSLLLFAFGFGLLSARRTVRVTRAQ